MAGEEFIPKPPGGCGWTSESGRETSDSERVGRAGRRSTELSREG